MKKITKTEKRENMEEGKRGINKKKEELKKMTKTEKTENTEEGKRGINFESLKATRISVF